MELLANFITRIKMVLLPELETQIGPLSDRERKFIRIIEMVQVKRFTKKLDWKRIGRKPANRTAMAHAFIAKAVWNLPGTKDILDLLHANSKLRRFCGWSLDYEIPSESTFSRVFAQFAEMELPQQIHAALIKTHWNDRLACHVSRDSTKIGAREKPEKKPKVKKTPVKRGRPKKGEHRIKPKRRLELQPERTLRENLADLPTACNVGAKTNSKGYKESWIGYKLHMDVMDGDIPVSAILTSASLHDSQAAIPLAQMTDERITHLYDLMDSAYDAPEIHAFSRALNHVPLIDHNRRGGQKRPFEPAQAQRYKARSSAERVNSNLKDNYGGRQVRVKGNAKVACHLMFGLVALTATQLYHVLC